MEYPIVQVKTIDNLWLYGLFVQAADSKTIFLHTHGTASNFYEEYFIEVLSKLLLENGISLLSFNNRGAGVYDAYQKSGAAVEIFEDCLIDLDAWIKFALEKGYEKIILSGHSLGTEKIVYYMNKGTYKNRIRVAVLLAPATSPGSEPELIGIDTLDLRLKQSEELGALGQGDTFLERNAYGNLFPKSAESFINSVRSDPEINKALPFHTGKLEMYSSISIPILAVIGDQEEYTAISPKEALDLMVKENPNTVTYQLQNCNHDFLENEQELSEIILKFINN